MYIHTYWSKLKIKSRQMSTAAAVLDGHSPEQQARMLTRLVSVILFTSLLISPIWILLSPDFIAARYISLGLVVALCVTYILSRIGQTNTASLLLSLTLIALIFATFFTAPGTITDRMLTLNFLILVVMLTSLFIPRLTLIVMTLSLATIGIFFFIPGAPPTVTFAYLVFFLSTISLGAAYNQLSGTYKRQLLESEQRYRSVVTALSEGVMLMAKDGTIQTVNKAAEQILGFTEEQVQGYPVINPKWQMVREDGTPFLGEEYPLIETLRTGKPISGVVMGLTHPDGRFHWVSINSQPIFHPDELTPFAVVASFTDITARKMDERALKEAQNWYHSLFEQRHDAVFILDLNGKHLEANQRAAELLGYTVEEIQQLTFRDLSAEPNQSEDKLVRLLAGESLPMYERTFYKKDGSEIPVEINVELVRNLDGQPLHIQSVVRDISERKRTQRNELDLALEKERIRVLTTFVHDASHEFRTPLSIISTTAFVMARLQDADQRLERAALIKEQVKRIVKLTEMLLLITKLEVGLPEDMVLVNIGTLFTLVCQRLEKPDAMQPTVRYTNDPNLPLVLGDPEELMEALRQILENAYRFSPKCGVITAVSGYNDTHVWLLIRDSGPGIRPENLPHIFDMFWREDEAHSTPGLGLGLAIAQKIIHRHGGKIEVVSERGVGSTFHVFLPISPLPE
jgi:PAS domain S-box-containing protein